MEAERHGGVHKGYLGGEDDQGRHPVAVLSIRGERPLIRLALAGQVEAVHSGTNATMINRDKGGSYLGYWDGDTLGVVTTVIYAEIDIHGMCDLICVITETE